MAHMYRIEDAFGDGPYMSRHTVASIDWTRDGSSATHPAPIKDIGVYGSSCRFGFASMGQLKAWFDHVMCTEMHALGFRVKVYSVPDDILKYGACQVAVRKELMFAITLLHITNLPLRR